MTRARFLCALCALVGCAPSDAATWARFDDFRAELVVSETGASIEAAATFVAWSEDPPNPLAEPDRVWLDSVSATLFDSWGGAWQSRPWGEVQIELQDVFPLEVARGGEARAELTLRSPAPALGEQPTCADAARLGLDARYYSERRDEQTARGTGALQGTAEIASPPPPAELSARWIVEDARNLCGGPAIDDSGRSWFVTCDQHIVIVDGRGRVMHDKPIAGPSETGLAAAGTTIALAGVFADRVDLGDATVPADGKAGVFVARLGPDLSTLWLHTVFPASEINCPLDDRGFADVSVSRTGYVAVAGILCGSMDLGGGELLGSDYLLLLGPDGSHQLSRGINASVESVAATNDGGLVAAGHHNGQLLLGEELEGSPQEHGVWVARWASSGELSWSRRIVARYGSSVARLDEEGNVLWLFTHGSAVELGGRSLGAAPFPNASLAKISAAGEVVWAAELARTVLGADARPPQLAVGRGGRIFAALSADGWFDRPTSVRTSGLVVADSEGTTIEPHLFACGGDFAVAARSDRDEVVLGGGSPAWFTVGAERVEPSGLSAYLAALAL